MMKNEDLKKIYNRVYGKGESKHYTKLILGKNKKTPEKTAILKEVSWKNKTVLDVGCGTGLLAYLIAKQGAVKVIGIDYAPKAIEVAKESFSHPALSYKCKDIKDIKGRFDVVISAGTLEHMDKPLAVLQKLKRSLNRHGSIILTVPNWTNPRGYILMTLRYLFQAKITLADIHYLAPLEFQKWAKKLKMKLTWKTIDYDWAHKDHLIKDFKRRLPNVARDSKLPTNKRRINQFIKWIEEHLPPIKYDSKYEGAVGLYHLRK